MEITKFAFETHLIRAAMGDNESIWLVAKDVCGVLGIANSRDAIRGLDEDEKGVVLTDTLGGPQNVTIISESGLYKLVFRSNKPEAKKFTKWVSSEVIPTIRKFGAYMTQEVIEKTLLDPDFIIKLAVRIKEEQEKVRTLTAEKAAMEPKVQIHDMLMDADTAISIGDVARILHKDFDIGRSRLFAFLRDQDVLMKDNLPKQTYMNRGYFRVVEKTYELEGVTNIYRQTLVYQKGIAFIIRLLQQEKAY